MSDAVTVAHLQHQSTEETRSIYFVLVHQAIAHFCLFIVVMAVAEFLQLSRFPILILFLKLLIMFRILSK